MPLFAPYVAMLAALPGIAGPTPPNRATFTLTGHVPVRCGVDFQDARFVPGSAVVQVNDQCNVEHRLRVSLGNALDGGTTQLIYQGRTKTAQNGTAHFSGLGFSASASELRIVIPGASEDQLRDAVARISLELDVLG